MKKFFIVILTIIFTFTLSACAKNQGLSPFVSELRSDLFEGKSEQYHLKAGYGFRESPYDKDGEVKQKVYLLTFKLICDYSQTTYTLNFEYGGQSYSSAFKLNPVTHSLTACFEIENFTEKQFTVNLSNGASSFPITLASIVPEGTIDYKTALSKLEKNEPELIKAFSDSNGNFNAEIHIRVVVKDNKSYWYVGFAERERLKAFLLDGKTGKALAVRDIF